MEPIVYILAVFSLAAFSALLLVPLAKWTAPWLGMMDEPSERRIHKKPIPRSGGLALYASVHLTCAAYFLFFGSSYALTEWIALLTGSSLLMLVGLFDDRYGLPAWVKLVGQIAVALLMFHYKFSVGGLLGLELSVWINLPATVFWFVLLINAFNLIDGMDGACGGIGMISALGMTAITLYFGQLELAVILVALAGACLGFLRYNFYPASVFLGDCGSMLIGFLLAGGALHADSRQSAFVTLLVPMLASGVPVFDVLIAVWRRLARKILARIYKDPVVCKVFGPDLDHLHHKLIKNGFTQRRAALTLYVSAALACLLAFVCVAFSSLRLAFLLAGVVLLLHVATRQIVHTELRITTQALLKGISRPNAYLRDTILIGMDLLWLTFSAWITLFIVSNGRVSVFVLFGMVLLMFSVLYFFGAYKILWSRSRISQMMTFVLELLSGGALVLLFLWAVDQNISFQPVWITWQYCQTALIGLIGLRVAPRVLRDVGSYLSMHADAATKENALILGGGPGAILFFQRKAFYDFDNHPRRVIGLVDDDPRLYRRKIYGYSVLGHSGQIEELVKKHNIREIILTEDDHQLDDSGLGLLVGRYHLKLRHFYPAVRDLAAEGTCRGEACAHSGKPFQPCVMKCMYRQKNIN